jgi:SAM-dependent methyltransferase
MVMLHDRMMAVLTDVVDVKGKTALEVGAGRGADSAHLSRLGATVTVLDFSSESCKQMRRTAESLGVELNVVEGDATAMPFPADSFDIVFHQGFLEHFEDPAAILNEQYRVLKPGGYLLIDVPQKYTLYTLRKKIAIMRKTWFGGWETQFSIGRLEQLVESCNFRVIRSYGWGFTGSFVFLRRPGVRRLWIRVMKGLRSLRRASDENVVTDEAAPITGTMGQKRYALWLVDNVGVLAQKK